MKKKMIKILTNRCINDGNGWFQYRSNYYIYVFRCNGITTKIYRGGKVIKICTTSSELNNFIDSIK